ncbi:MAG: Fic family protein [Gemmatimonadota bacterium]
MVKLPPKPPTLDELFEDSDVMNAVSGILGKGSGPEADRKYHHWATLIHLEPPRNLTHRQWWFGLKYSRRQLAKEISLRDTEGRPFWYAMADGVLRLVHRVDRDASGRIEISEQVTNPETRDRYIINSLIQEAITSSQLEGASTTVEQAKEMLRTGRRPLDRSEQMILNNFQAMRHVRELSDQPLTRELILELQEIVTRDTLDGPKAAGRFRTGSDDIVVSDTLTGQVLHRPPRAEDLESRVALMCDFANDMSEGEFVHPVVRAIILHFWLGYDHPFVDGNGRTARALFYWSMLSRGYWLAEYISISRILRAAPSKYARSYLYTETDENDLTYFVLYQLQVIDRAIDELHRYLRKKIEEVQRVERLIRRSAQLNHRQLAVLSHALKHPDARYTIRSHRTSHNVVYQTARTDLLGLEEKGLLERRKVGRTYLFAPYGDLGDRLLQLDR